MSYLLNALLHEKIIAYESDFCSASTQVGCGDPVSIRSTHRARGDDCDALSLVEASLSKYGILVSYLFSSLFICRIFDFSSQKSCFLFSHCICFCLDLTQRTDVCENEIPSSRLLYSFFTRISESDCFLDQI